MALPGVPPSENKRRRNGDAFGAEKVELTEEDLVKYKTIPEGTWHPEVLLWWECWTTCAQSTLFTVTDWMRLRTLIVTRQSYQDRPTPQKMAEIRQTEGLWGATYVDRMKARIRINRPAEGEKKTPLAAVKDIKERMQKAG